MDGPQGSEGSKSTFALICFTLVLFDLVDFEGALPVTTLNGGPRTDIQEDLEANVWYQTQAINTLVDALNSANASGNNMNIVTFIGSSGTGKTYTANVVRRHFHEPVFDLFGPLNSFDKRQQDLVENIKASRNKHNLLVIDDLTISDGDILLTFINHLHKVVNIFVICIFNIQETDFNLNHTINYSHIELIKDKFDKAGIYSKFAIYRELTDIEANNWVKTRLIDNGVEPEVVLSILDEVLAGSNVKFQGLKGLQPKMNLKM